MAKFRKKPVEVQAFRWTGGPDQTEDPIWICDAIRDGWVSFSRLGTPHYSLDIHVDGGILTAWPGDWIVQGVNGEIHPVRDDIFRATYEPVEE